MPKTPFTTLSFPLSGLFGIIKPSGPTSMSIVNDLQRLITRSRLFVDAEKLELSRGKKKAQMHRKKGTVKVGQGGTLDPLADGVLGEGLCSYLILLVHDV
jgi:tRNA pseudouridine55 synthase